jgi:hypothetical protein
MHTFIGGFFPVFNGSVKNLEIMSQGDQVRVGFASDRLSYDFMVEENATVGLCCKWRTSLGDPDWPQKVLKRLDTCITRKDEASRIVWGCTGCEFAEEDVDG